ncbi:MAG: hypothetical protein ACTSQA_04470 [Candidatus Heimdallarchaeaceae archaeon]
MAGKPKGVMIRVSANFFDNIFEKERKKLEAKEKIRFSQENFTEFLAKKDIKLIPQKMDNKFSPKPLRRKRL